MHLYSFSATLAALFILAGKVQTKAVFAHYLVSAFSYSNATAELRHQVGSITQDHVHQDIDNAIAMG